MIVKSRTKQNSINVYDCYSKPMTRGVNTTANDGLVRERKMAEQNKKKLQDISRSRKAGWAGNKHENRLVVQKGCRSQ